MFIRIDNKWDLLQVRAAHQGKTRTKIQDDINFKFKSAKILLHPASE